MQFPPTKKIDFGGELMKEGECGSTPIATFKTQRAKFISPATFDEDVNR